MAPTKTVLITGATRGIGLELAVQYKNNGWNVIGAARDVTAAAKLDAVAPYKIVQIDTGDEASILQAAKSLEGETIDLLINNAGIGVYDSFDTVTKASMMRQFEVNTVGPLLISRAFAPHLRAAVAANGSAVVAQISSFMASITLNDGVTAGTGNYGYRAAKTGLNQVNMCLAYDFKKDKILTVAIHPGYVATDINAHAGTMQPAESVSAMAKLIAGLKEEDTGKYFNYDGTSMPW